jgi:hypothetical protein
MRVLATLFMAYPRGKFSRRVTEFADSFCLRDNTSRMELSKAVAGTALILIVVLAVGHAASAQTKSRETPAEKMRPAAQSETTARSDS